jgi:hypothetical protein
MFAATKSDKSKPWMMKANSNGRWLIGRQGQKLKKAGRQEQELMEDMIKGFMIISGLAFAAGTALGAALSSK